MCLLLGGLITKIESTQVCCHLQISNEDIKHFGDQSMSVDQIRQQTCWRMISAIRFTLTRRLNRRGKLLTTKRTLAKQAKKVKVLEIKLGREESKVDQPLALEQTNIASCVAALGLQMVSDRYASAWASDEPLLSP